MPTTTRCFAGLATLPVLFSTAASWSLTFYPTYDGCQGKYHDGEGRGTYAVYFGTGPSTCIIPGMDAAGATCQYTEDGGVTFSPCTAYQDFGAFNIAAGTKCNWGPKCYEHSLTQWHQGSCFETSSYAGDILYFTCTDAES